MIFIATHYFLKAHSYSAAEHSKFRYIYKNYVKRGDDELCTNNFPPYKIPGLKRPPEHQARNVSCYEHHELFKLYIPTPSAQKQWTQNWNTAVFICSWNLK